MHVYSVCVQSFFHRTLVITHSMVNMEDHQFKPLNNFYITGYLYLLKYKNNIKYIKYFEFYLFTFLLISLSLMILTYMVKDYEMRLILFDWSIFIGGIRIYNTALFILAITLAIMNFYLFHFETDDVEIFKWIKLLKILSGWTPLNLYTHSPFIIEEARNICNILNKTFIFVMVLQIIMGELIFGN